MSPIIIATCRSWSNTQIDSLQKKLSRNVILLTNKEDLSKAKLDVIAPEYIFFPHWSYIIEPEIYENYECVVFHMTDLPFGRGGSPLQNLIVRGIFETQLTALRCVKNIDAGPIYCKRPLSLHGNAEEIYLRAYKLAENLIVDIVVNKPLPKQQIGEVVSFSRRIPTDGDINDLGDIEKVYDYIRMLDADGYPRAFLETEYLRFEFERASLKDGHIHADVKIFRKES